MWLNCKVIKKVSSPPPPFSDVSPLSSKKFWNHPSDSIFGRSYPPFNNRGGRVPTMCTLLRLNATPKPLQLPFLFFFFFSISFSSLFFQGLPKVFLPMFHHFSHRKRETKTYFTGHTKSSLRKNCSFKLLLATSRAYEKSCHYLW